MTETITMSMVENSMLAMLVTQNGPEAETTSAVLSFDRHSATVRSLWPSASRRRQTS